MTILRYSDFLEEDALCRDLDYLKAVHALPCVVCDAFGFTQTSLTETHHVICGRFGQERTPDRLAIPLCQCRHQGLRHDRDRTKIAIHQNKAAWVEVYGNDFEYIAVIQDLIERLCVE